MALLNNGNYFMLSQVIMDKQKNYTSFTLSAYENKAARYEDIHDIIKPKTKVMGFTGMLNLAELYAKIKTLNNFKDATDI